MSTQNQFNEAETRYNVIDPLVKKSGWDLADRRAVGFEIPVERYDDASLKVVTIHCIFDNYCNVFVVEYTKSFFIQIKNI